MLLWLIFAVMTAAALAVVLRPVFDPATQDRALMAAPDVVVYKEQLVDLDRQLAQGSLTVAEHTALYAEVARRILRADRPADTAAAAPATSSLLTWPTSVVASAVAAVLPVAALVMYLALGAPFVPAHPAVVQGGALATASAGELIAKVEARLATNPNDGRGWDVIAPIYFKLGRFADAADAYDRALRMLGETQDRLAGFAEASVQANDGIVTEGARLAYEKLAILAPGRSEPRFWLALAKEQDGKSEAAAADYRALLADAPADAAWRSVIEQRLAAVTASKSPTARGPTTADVEAAASMSDADRRVMIERMVEGLAVRLKSNGKDADGWGRLIGAYLTLGDPARARSALVEARAALAGDTAAASVFDALARRLEAKP